jgi:uncharacterized protein YodC (DUF2158 family)
MNDDGELAVGTIVRLKSGGPKMTVHKVKRTVVTCHWASGENIRKKDFEHAELEVADRLQRMSDKELRQLIAREVISLNAFEADTFDVLTTPELRKLERLVQSWLDMAIAELSRRGEEKGVEELPR